MPDQALIEDWLARNGGARRFERGASGNPENLAYYLKDRGYEVRYSAKDGRRAIVSRQGARGQHKFSYLELVAFVDSLRQAEGLHPLRASAR
jgi:hypothetical protein